MTKLNNVADSASESLSRVFLIPFLGENETLLRSIQSSSSKSSAESLFNEITDDD